MLKYHWIVFVICLLSGFLLACGSLGDSDIESYAVKRGEFVSSITVTGELRAVSSQVIHAPSTDWSLGQLKIIKIVDDGSRVKEGDLLIQFDPSMVQKSYDDAKSQLEIAQAELAKSRVNHKSEMAGLVADLEIAELDCEISKLKLEQAEFKAEIDRKQIELDLEKSTLNLEQKKVEIENKKKVQQEEISKQELKVRQEQTKMEQAEQTLNSLTIFAPTPGIAIVREKWRTNDKYQVDDQVYPGWDVIGLPDLSLMKAMVEVNEVDIAKIDTGQAAAVKLDAYPDTSFSGRVVDIATLARAKTRNSKVKVFDASVLLDGSDEKLIPGMTVSCEIIVDRVPDTLFIPLAALFNKDGESVVYVKNGSGFDLRKVEAGMENDNYVIIDKGLEEGERVALVDPTLKVEESRDKESDGKENDK